MHKYVKRFLAAALSTITIFSTVGTSFAETENTQSKAHVEGTDASGSYSNNTHMYLPYNPHHSSQVISTQHTYANSYGCCNEYVVTLPNNECANCESFNCNNSNSNIGGISTLSVGQSNSSITRCIHNSIEKVYSITKIYDGITLKEVCNECSTCGKVLSRASRITKGTDSAIKNIYGTIDATGAYSGNFKITTIDQKPNTLTFKWADSNKNAKSYQVFKCYDGTYDGKCTWKGSKNITGKVKGNSVTVSNCNHTGKVFGFYVESFDKNGKHLGYSQILCTKRLRYDTGTPQIFKKGTQYGVKWNKAASTQGYIVEVSENSFKSNEWKAIKVSGSNTTQIFPGLQKGKKYSVRVTTFGTCIIPKFSITVKDNKNKKHTLKWTPNLNTYTITGQSSVAKVYKMQ